MHSNPNLNLNLNPNPNPNPNSITKPGSTIDYRFSFGDEEGTSWTLQIEVLGGTGELTSTHSKLPCIQERQQHQYYLKLLFCVVHILNDLLTQNMSEFVISSSMKSTPATTSAWTYVENHLANAKIVSHQKNGLNYFCLHQKIVDST